MDGGSNQDVREERCIDLDKELERLDAAYSIDAESSDDLHPLEGIEKIVGQDGALIQMLHYLSMGENVLLIGKKGTGQITMCVEALKSANLYLQLPRQELWGKKTTWREERQKKPTLEEQLRPILEERIVDLALSRRSITLRDQVLFYMSGEDYPLQKVTLPQGDGEKLRGDLASFTEIIKSDHVPVQEGEYSLIALQKKLIRKYNSHVKKLNFDAQNFSYSYSIHATKIGTKSFLPKNDVTVKLPKKELLLESQTLEAEENKLQETEEKIKKKLRENRKEGKRLINEMDKEYRELKMQTDISKINHHLSRLEKIITEWNRKPEFENQQKLVKILQNMYNKIEQEGILFHQETITPLIDQYEVSIAENKKNVKGYPIIVVSGADLTEIVGEVVGEPDGKVPTHKRIIWGRLLDANGGVLILEEGTQILENENLVYKLEKVLKTKEHSITRGTDHSQYEGINERTPPFKADFSTIFCIDEESEEFLDSQPVFASFREKFKRVHLNEYMKNTKENRIKVARFIKTKQDNLNNKAQEKGQEKFPSFDHSSIVSLMEYLALNSLSLNYFLEGFLCTDLRPLSSLIKGVASLARSLGVKRITREHIAHYLMEERKNASCEQETIMDGIIQDDLIKLKGEKVGQVKSLYIIEKAGQDYGSVDSVEATLIKDIHEPLLIESITKQADGPLIKGWEMGVEFLRRHFCTKSIPLRLSFPQSAKDEGGNSSSVAGLVACLSALSKIPFSQGAMITGAIYSPDGAIGAIGGVYPKIKGAYELAKRYNFNNEQCAIIPTANLSEFVLAAQFDQELCQASKDGKFPIYHVNNIDQVLALGSNSTAEEHYQRARETIDQIQKHQLKNRQDQSKES